MADTYTLWSWTRDRGYHYALELVEEAADFIPLVDALGSVQLFVGKFSKSGIRLLLPRKPKISEFPGFPQEAAFITDIWEDKARDPIDYVFRVAMYLRESYSVDRVHLSFAVVMPPQWQKDP